MALLNTAMVFVFRILKCKYKDIWENDGQVDRFLFSDFFKGGKRYSRQKILPY